MRIPLLAFLLVGCPTPDEPLPPPEEDTDLPATDTDPPPTLPEETGDPGGCAPLSIWADPAGVPALHPTQLYATGGSGEVSWELIANPSGGVINAFTGTYLAGEFVGVTDVVQATDALCGFIETTDVEILNRLEVDPPGGTVRFGASFDLVITGGSATVTCSLVSSAGSVLSGCSYTAGAVAGFDLITVEDPLTEEVVEVAFEVAQESGFGPGAAHIVVPLGASYVPGSIGGSGSIDLIAGGAEITILDGAIVGASPGRTTVTLEDRYLGDQVVLPVDVVAPLNAAELRDGERSVQGVVRTADLDGDGFTDAVVGTGEPSVGAWYSGVVYVYRGSASGLEAAPSQVFTIPHENARFGSDLALGDFDGDGEIDLAVGADYADLAGTDSGAVYVHRGVPGGFFEVDPTRTYVGDFSSDHFGRSLTACDFNGDGTTDLALGGYAMEDRTQSPTPTNQGAVRIYLGSPFGLPPNPEQVVHGMAAESGVFEHTANLQLGHRLTSGDWNNDGKCDLFAASSVYAVDGSGSDGAVFLYLGAPGGVEAEPARYFALQSADTSSQFGFRLTAGDLDGDGRADLLVGSWAEDTTLATSGGKVRLFRAASHDGPATEFVDADAADWTVEGTGSSEYVGLDVAIADVDGDTQVEIVVSAPYVTNSLATRGGLILAFENDAIGIVGQGTGSVLVEGSEAYAFFGMAMAPLANPPGFGILASRDSVDGPEAGAVYWSDGTVLSRLEFPGEASGGNLGAQGSMAWGDVDGNGSIDLVGGANEAAHSATVGPSAGRVHSFSGAAASASQPWGGHVHHDSWDRFGSVIESAGDFDGDGFDDLLIVSQRDSKPSTFGTGILNPDACPGSISQTGSAWVFRGGPSGVAADPSFVYYSPGSSDWIEAAAVGFDHNGDGIDDIAVGGPRWASNGGIGILHGRAADPTGITVLCSADTLVYGASSNARMGTALVGLPDVDGDGCDELAVGIDADDLGRGNQGSVRILWGAGGASCPAAVTVSTLVGGTSNDRAGGTLAAGPIDGDGLRDLLVGMPLSASSSGRIAVIRGSRLTGLVRDALVGDALPADANTTMVDMVEPGWARAGNAGSELGRGVAVLPGNRIAVGFPGDGGVEVFAVDASGIRPVPVVVVAGEGGTGRLGAGILGARSDGTWAIGAPRSDTLVLDGGAIYPIPPP